MNTNYARVCDAFVRLCLIDAPVRLVEERKMCAPGEFDALCDHPLVASVGVSGQSLFIATKRIAMTVSGAEYHWVGEFLCCINVKTKEITYEGSDPKDSPSSFSKICHPHVQAAGTACFGEKNRQEFANWFGDGKLAHVALHAIEFLCLARGASHYVHPGLWPLLTEEEKEAWKALRR